MKRITLFSPRIGLLLAGLLLVSVGCKQTVELQSPARTGSARVRVNQSITEVVVGNANFSLLRAAVVRAGLAQALATGDLTVFAPTNAAFQAAGFADENAINNADLGTLTRILTYHVIGGNRFFADRIPTRLAGFTTLQGSQVQIVRMEGSLAVNGNVVTQADLEANNGVIHVIDRVLLPPAGNLIEVAVANPNLTYLVAALQRAGLAQTIGTGGPFTVFAPTNAAFQAAGFPTIAAIQAADPAVLSRILLYHVLNERAFTPQLSIGEIRTLEGRLLTTSQSPGRATVQGLGNAMPSLIQAPNVIALNGVVHVIDQVLLPDGAAATQSITNIVVGNANFSLLRAAVVRAGLAQALATGNLTVFAPTNAAFQAAGFADENAINNADLGTLTRILTYHVIGGGRFLTTQIPTRLTGFTTLQGSQVQLVREQRGVFANGIVVSQANVRATNGVIHVIDRVLLPPAGNLIEVAVANPNLTYLVAALQRAGLAQTIGTGGPFTVFAPTNAAFQAAGFPTIAAIQAADPAVLSRILLYHVLNERTFAALLRTDNVRTLQGSDVFVSAMPGSVTVRGRSNASPATVVAADVVTLNGVVHVIDSVLLP